MKKMSTPVLMAFIGLTLLADVGGNWDDFAREPLMINNIILRAEPR